MNAILTRDLTKTYSTRSKHAVKALSGVSLEVRPGEIFGLLGPNGAGKTTFIKLLLGIIHPTGGEAHVLSARIGDVGVRKRIGYLPENHRFPPYLTGGQVLSIFGRLGGMDGAARRSRIGEMLDLVEMGRWRDTKTAKYSHGMLQRLGLAHALLNDPDLLILDEPTEGLDPVGRKRFRDLLLDLRGKGKTIFLNSHILSEVERVCDRVAILNRGRLVRSGSVREMTESEHVVVVTLAEEIPPALRRQWEAVCAPISVDGLVVTATVRDTRELNRLIDEIRQHGGLIDSVVKKKSTLEELFLEAVTENVV
ncbi:MAG: ABC transporter ATP-binding protein [Bacteroidota bacterium]|nr:ABC transporter ATP-binding protein [Bacteroidota bacterium]